MLDPISEYLTEVAPRVFAAQLAKREELLKSIKTIQEAMGVQSGYLDDLQKIILATKAELNSLIIKLGAKVKDA